MSQDKSQLSIFSRQDTLASPSVSLGSARAQKMTATSGHTSLKLLHAKDPLGAFSKTFMATFQWASTRCYLTWKAKATPRGRLLFQLAVSMPPTEETDCGSSPKMWRTPDTGAGGTSGLLKEGKTHREDGQPIQIRLVDQVNNPRLWPTPTARDYKDNGRSPAELARNSKTLATHAGGSLNPQWVEWLMGYPEGWTDLED